MDLLTPCGARQTLVSSGVPRHFSLSVSLYFTAFYSKYVVIEPDTGGETVKKWLAKSAIRERTRLVSLGRIDA